MNRKLAFIIGLAISVVLSFVATYLTKLTLQGYSVTVDVSDAIVFLCSIVVGPWGAIASAIGVAIGDLVSGLGLGALYSFIVCTIEGVSCALLYKFAFRDKKILTCKILSILIAVLVGVVCTLAIEVIINTDTSVAMVGFVAKSVAKVICGLVVVLILPKIPHYFDEERFIKDVQDE